MPTHGSDDFTTSSISELNNARSIPLTPPPDFETISRRSQNRRITTNNGLATDNNTAAGMSMRQEDTLYIGQHSLLDTSSITLEKEHPNEIDSSEVDSQTDKFTTAHEYMISEGDTELDTPITPVSISICDRADDKQTNSEEIPDISLLASNGTPKSLGQLIRRDDQFDLSTLTRPWDCTYKQVDPRFPGSIFRPFAKFTGNQQSDRQIYNVEVTVLTVNMEQSTTSGYLQICGLTPDHPTLTTFFTGEIIGGPDQKYSFRTRHPDWGTSDKVDLTHWARFPAFRPLITHAKKDLDFAFPPGKENWWQQETIFMRWKEHFLVPDHKLKSIQGASFEGFYYICFNQVEGKISGIYFHSRSEKYQQLELKHEGTQGVWSKGVCPSIEFR